MNLSLQQTSVYECVLYSSGICCSCSSWLLFLCIAELKLLPGIRDGITKYLYLQILVISDAISDVLDHRQTCSGRDTEWVDPGVSGLTLLDPAVFSPCSALATITDELTTIGNYFTDSSDWLSLGQISSCEVICFFFFS